MDAGIEGAVEAVLVPSNEMPKDAIEVKGPSVLKGNLGSILDKYHTTGYQATNFGAAVEEVKAMLQWRLLDDTLALNTVRKHGEITDEEAADTRTKVFLGVTSGLFCSGVRESLCFLCRHKMVHVIVTPGGGIDNDVARTLEPADDTSAPARYNEGRVVGNISLPESSRSRVVDFLKEQVFPRCPELTTPSALVRLIATSLPPSAASSSPLYWCARNDIPVYCPSIVDGWVGEALFEYNEHRLERGEKPLQVDLVQDVKGMNCEATKARHTGMLILGGGVVKHHICNANLMRNGADHSIFIGTGQEFDGSDAGARPDEAVSWGKIRPGTRPIKVYADASFVLPLLVAKSFVPFLKENRHLYPN